jgi:hypothetical protein
VPGSEYHNLEIIQIFLRSFDTENPPFDQSMESVTTVGAKNRSQKLAVPKKRTKSVVAANESCDC